MPCFVLSPHFLLLCKTTLACTRIHVTLILHILQKNKQKQREENIKVAAFNRGVADAVWEQRHKRATESDVSTCKLVGIALLIILGIVTRPRLGYIYLNSLGKSDPFLAQPQNRVYVLFYC